MINISINLGPGVIWFSMCFIAFWVGVGCFRAGQIASQISYAREIQHRQRQLLAAPWQAPGPPLFPSRVNPEIALIRSHPPIEGDEAA